MTYAGEVGLGVEAFLVCQELFDGFIEYGVEMRCDYQKVLGQRVMIHGHGAFTMELLSTPF